MELDAGRGTVDSVDGKGVVFCEESDNAWQAKRSIPAMVMTAKKRLLAMFPFLGYGFLKKRVFADSF
jgi:hypothetical protein